MLCGEQLQLLSQLAINQMRMLELTMLKSI